MASAMSGFKATITIQPYWSANVCVASVVAHTEAEGALLSAQLDELAAERLSLIEQRDRMQAELDCSIAELARVERERALGEELLHRITSTRWFRLAERYWALRARLR